MITGLSDHNLILVARKLTNRRFQSPANREPELRRIPKNELQNFRDTIQGLNWNDLISGANLEEESQTLLSIVQNMIQQYTRDNRNKKGKKIVYHGLTQTY